MNTTNKIDNFLHEGFLKVTSWWNKPSDINDSLRPIDNKPSTIRYVYVTLVKDQHSINLIDSLGVYHTKKAAQEDVWSDGCFIEEKGDVILYHDCNGNKYAEIYCVPVL